MPTAERNFVDVHRGGSPARRGLAYPALLAWDYEGSPQLATLTKFQGFAGNWDLHKADPRWDGTMGEPLFDGMTLRQIWDAGGTISPGDINKNIFDAGNLSFLNFWSAWRIFMRQQALKDAVFDVASASFPQSEWLNYDDFVADNPGYKFQDNRPGWEFNTPTVDLYADYSNPVCYGPRRYDLFEREPDWSGLTRQQIFRRVFGQRIDACRNSYLYQEFVPWLLGVGNALEGPPGEPDSPGTGYRLTEEDVFFTLMRAWRAYRPVSRVLVFQSRNDWNLDQPGNCLRTVQVVDRFLRVVARFCEPLPP